MQLGQTIQKIRKENHLTQEEFAEIFHVTKTESLKLGE